MDCLYTLFKNQFIGKIAAEGGQVLKNVQSAVYFTQRNKGVDKMCSIAKKIFLEKIQKAFLEQFPAEKNNVNN